MAEPLPPSIHEGASSAPAPTSNTTSAPTELDAALPSTSSTNKSGPTPALNDAVSCLSVTDNPSSEADTAAQAAAAKEAERKRKAALKLDPAHVSVLVEALGVSKPVATELLREGEGDLGRALREWVGLSGGSGETGPRGDGVEKRTWVGGSSMSRPVGV